MNDTYNMKTLKRNLIPAAIVSLGVALGGLVLYEISDGESSATPSEIQAASAAPCVKRMATLHVERNSMDTSAFARPHINKKDLKDFTFACNRKAESVTIVEAQKQALELGASNTVKQG